MSAIDWVRAAGSLRRSIKTPVLHPIRTRHKGVIVTTSPLTLYLDGNTSIAVPAHCLAGYTPVASDVVFVDNVQGDLVVVHKYAS